MRLLNALFEDADFLIDKESVPYIVRDIINMNWWNTCDYLLGYKKNKRTQIDATYDMKLIGILTKEFYRYRINKEKNLDLFKKQMEDFLKGSRKTIPQLKYYSMDYRKNESQYFYKDGKSSWLDCTSRATYAWKYVGQNGYIDFDGVLRVIDGNRISNFIPYSVYPYKEKGLSLFSEGGNQVKKEIFSQKQTQFTVKEWIKNLDIKVLESREWLYEEIKHIKTDPYKNNEKKLLEKGLLTGVNELLYGFKTGKTLNFKDASRASDASGAIRASSAGDASHASSASAASHVSRSSSASDASNASNASNASRASDTSEASNVRRVSHASGAIRASSASDASNASRASDTSASRASVASRSSRASNASRASDASAASDAASDASNVSRASVASVASRASRASYASDASRASDVSKSHTHDAIRAGNASSVSDAGVITSSASQWEHCSKSIGKIDGLTYPKFFGKNKYGIAGHWKIDKTLLSNVKTLIDPFFGWGETPLFCAKNGIDFTGLEINPDTMNGYILPYILPACKKWGSSKIDLRCVDASILQEDLISKFDMCYTSPPYFQFEEYGFHNKKIFNECSNYEDFHIKVIKPIFKNVKKYLKDDGVLALQVEKNTRRKNQWREVMESLGFKILSDSLTGQEKIKYSTYSKRDQNLLIFN